jgi:predicted AlkP superfamily phosphohydrolase/phosphomutase
MTIYLLGLDGASTNTIQETLARRKLPNFERLMKRGAFADLRSVYPYVTAPAWTTLFSGVNPGKHGIFEMFEVRENKVVPSNMRATDVPFLWDYLTWASKRSLVIGIPFIYPAPKINGIFVTGRFAPKLSSYPDDLSSRFDLGGFDYDDLSMEEKTEKIFVQGSDTISKKILDNLERRAETITKMIDSENWDVVIAVEGLPDDLLHLSYGDDAIVDEMYSALDRFIGQVLQRMKQDDILIVFSDHGFGTVENVLFMNEWLLGKNYTKLNEKMFARFLLRLGIDWDSLSKQGFTSKSLRFLLEHFPWIANKTMDSVRSSMVVDESQQFKNSKVSAFSINEPLAWLRISEKGGVRVSEECLITELEELRRQKIIKNIFETEKIYSGKYVRFAPGQLLIESSPGWTIDTLRWNKRNLTGKPLFTKKGVHRREGVIFIYGNNLPLGLESARVHDLVPTVLSLMRLPMPESLDGKSLIGLQQTSTTALLNIAQRL